MFIILYSNGFGGIEFEGGVDMYSLLDVEKRTIEEALWVIGNDATIRQTAKELCVSKSTVGNDLLHRLPKISIVLSDQVATIMRKHWIEKGRKR